MKKHTPIALLFLFGVATTYANFNCIDTAAITVCIDPITPVFNSIAVVGNGSALSKLPKISSNGITGIWSVSSISNDGIYTYLFTPNTGQNATTLTLSSFRTSNPNLLIANDDQYELIEGGTTDSVFGNDTLNGNPIYTSIADFDVTIDLPQNNNTPFAITNDGKISIPEGTPQGDYSIAYKIYQKTCLNNYYIANVLLRVRSVVDATARKSNYKIANNNIVAFPNPSNGLYNVDLTHVKESYDSIKVFNVLGATVYENKLNSKFSNLIDLSDMPTGCYIAQVYGNKDVISFQLIKL